MQTQKHSTKLDFMFLPSEVIGLYTCFTLLFMPYACVTLPGKHHFVKLGEKSNCLKIGFGRAPAPRSVCEAFRGFRQIRVLPQAISNQYFPPLPSENHKNIYSNCHLLQHPLPWPDCWITWDVQTNRRIKRNQTKKLLDIRALTTHSCNSPHVLHSHLF